MYAIVNIAGQQYKVEKDQKIFVHRLEGKEGDSLNFDEVLLIDNDKNIMVGEPIVKGARIVGKVLSHPKGDKVQVFKKKRRKGYKVQKGHRQYMTEIQIQDIIEKAAAPKKTVVSKKPEDAKATPKTGEKKTTTTAKKPATTAKKPAASAKKTTSTAKKTSTPKAASKTAKPAAKKDTDQDKK